MRPVRYAECEGGLWLKWTGKSDIFEGELQSKRAMRAVGQPVIWISGLTVHVIEFSDGRKWDVINGWRKV